jgi:predicted AlkP superfamily pyrophosphatase or phosphodiesterase
MYSAAFNHPNLNQIAAKGVLAEMIPQFPSSTFPNHWAIITGLYPESNGLVGNRFRDPTTGEVFDYTNSEVMLNPKWWKGQPFWALAKEAGLKTATYFWPGSEVAVNGSADMMPDYLIAPYQESVPGEDRVKQILSWLDMDWTVRPSFLTVRRGFVFVSLKDDHGCDINVDFWLDLRAYSCTSQKWIRQRTNMDPIRPKSSRQSTTLTRSLGSSSPESRMLVAKARC